MKDSKRKILLIGPFPPPFAGMSIQMNLWKENLLREGNIVGCISSLPRLRKLPFVRWPIFFFHFLAKFLRFDIINIHTGSGLYYIVFTIPTVVISRIFGKKVFVTYKGGDAEEYFGYFPIGKYFLKLATGVIVPSGFLKDVFARMGIRANIVFNILSIRDSGEGSIPDRAGKIHFIVARNLQPYYNNRMAIDAFRIVKAELPGSVLHIFGDGSERTKLEEYVKRSDLHDVIFHGNVRQEELYRYYRNSDIFLNPSNYDNAPNSVIESFYFKVPIVSTDVGGVPYLVIHGENGFLVKPGDAAGMAQHALKLIRDKELAEKFRKNGYEVVRNRSWESIYENYLKVIESA